MLLEAALEFVKAVKLYHQLGVKHEPPRPYSASSPITITEEVAVGPAFLTKDIYIKFSYLWL